MSSLWLKTASFQEGLTKTLGLNFFESKNETSKIIGALKSLTKKIELYDAADKLHLLPKSTYFSSNFLYLHVTSQ